VASPEGRRIAEAIEALAHLGAIKAE